MASPTEAWPELPLDAWEETRDTLHLWTQVVGKVRLALTPWSNHSWHCPLYVTARGLTTSPMAVGSRYLEIEFDFLDHVLRFQTSANESRTLELVPCTVADFYLNVMKTLQSLDVNVRLNTTPNEIADAIPFHKDTVHASYDGEYARRFWLALVQTDRVLKIFRARFTGKCSPVHFFWGSFDMAVTRFSGRPAPEHPGGVPNLSDVVTREAYSHEVSSAGFWTGGGPIPYPVFYSYAYPTPEGFAQAKVRPPDAVWQGDLGEFVLPYDAVREADNPDRTLLAFLEDTYAAAADLAAWSRVALEDTSRFPG